RVGCKGDGLNFRHSGPALPLDRLEWQDARVVKQVYTRGLKPPGGESRQAGSIPAPGPTIACTRQIDAATPSIALRSAVLARCNASRDNARFTKRKRRHRRR